MKNIVIVLLAVTQIHAMSFFQSEQPQVKVPTYTPPAIKKKPMACLTHRQMLEQGIFYCPSPTELTKNNMKWTGPSPWKAYSESFVERIDRFTGAQWSGPTGTVGRLVCYYNGVQKDTFPVKITTTVLIKVPTLPLWESDQGSAENTLMNCISTSGNTCDCPFSIVQSAEKPNSVKDLEQHAKTSPTLTDGKRGENA